MKIRISIFSFTIASFLITSCGSAPAASAIATNGIPPTHTIAHTSTVSVPTVEATEPSVPTGFEAENLFSFNEMGISIGFNYPEGFNQGASTSILDVYEPNAPFELAYPQHARILFTAYISNTEESFFTAGIRVFRVDEINTLEAGIVESLAAVLLGNTDHRTDFPRLAGAGSTIDDQVAVVSFQNGNGYRFLNSKSFAAQSLGDTDTTFLYQGMTNDEKYFVSFVFRVDAPFLADLVNLPLTTQEDFENYFPSVHNRVAEANADDFVPSLNILDELISSIVVIEK
jgi:hypothetical protein